MKPDEQVCDLNDCRHLFHADCLDKWLETKNECPLCKKQLDIYAAAPAPAVELLLLNPNAGQQPFEQYFRNILEVRQNFRAMEELRRGRNAFDADAGRIADREFELAFQAIHLQFRAVQRNMMRQRAIQQALRAAAIDALQAQPGRLNPHQQQ